MNGPGERPLLKLGRRVDTQAHLLARGAWLPDSVDDARFDIPGSRRSGSIGREAVLERFGALLSAREREVLSALVSELLNNAVLHGGADAEHHVILHIAVAPERLRAEVCDGGPGLDPRDLRERGHGEGGRGFVIVNRLASRWGVSTDDGTCVWFEIDRAED